MIGCHTGALCCFILLDVQDQFDVEVKWHFTLINFWQFFRATGDDTRSLCTTVCKWTYLGHAHMQHINDKDSRDMEACGWDDDFWEEIGLGDLVEGHHAKIGILNQLTLPYLL